MKKVGYIMSSFAPPMRVVLDIPNKPKCRQKMRKLRRHNGSSLVTYCDTSYHGIWMDVVINPHKYYKRGAEISR